LSNDKCEDHIHGHVYTLSSRSDFQRENFTRHQPPEGSPRPGKSCNVDANEKHHYNCIPLGQVSRITTYSKFSSNCDCNNNLHTCRNQINNSQQSRIVASKAGNSCLLFGFESSFIKPVRLFNPNQLIMCWVHVELAGRIKNYKFGWR
jgi:hypothetical protein